MSSEKATPRIETAKSIKKWMSSALWILATTVGVGNSWQYMGCYEDGLDRTFEGAHNATPSMTNNECQAYCQAGGFPVSGTQNAMECSCGSVAEQEGGNVVPDSDCHQDCVGDPTTKCGGPYKMTVYRNNDPVSTAWEYLGCYQDTTPRIFQGGSMGVPTSSNKIDDCKEFSEENGFEVLSIQNGDQCLYGTLEDLNGVPMIKLCKLTQNDKYIGGSWAMTTYRHVLPTSEWLYKGCFQCNGNEGVFRFHGVLLDPSNAECQRSCKAGGYSLAAMGYGDQCYCGLGWELEGVSRSKKCDTLCSGQQGVMCGGEGGMSVYLRTISPPPNPSEASDPDCTSGGQFRLCIYRFH